MPFHSRNRVFLAGSSALDAIAKCNQELAVEFQIGTEIMPQTVLVPSNEEYTLKLPHSAHFARPCAHTHKHTATLKSAGMNASDQRRTDTKIRRCATIH